LQFAIVNVAQRSFNHFKKSKMNNDLQAIATDIAEIKTAMLQTKTVFSPKEAASYMGISQSTLYKMTSGGIVPFSKPNGKLLYFSRTALDNWLLSNPNKSEEQKETEAATYVVTH
jgi:excisionase family DNA binding protein